MLFLLIMLAGIISFACAAPALSPFPVVVCFSPSTCSGSISAGNHPPRDFGV